MSDSFSGVPHVGDQAPNIIQQVFKDSFKKYLNDERSKTLLLSIERCVLQNQPENESLKINADDYQKLFLQCHEKDTINILDIINNYLYNKYTVYIEENTAPIKKILSEMVKAFPCELSVHGFDNLYKPIKVDIEKVFKLPVLYNSIIVSLIPYESLLDKKPNLVATITRRCRDELSGSSNKDKYVRFLVDSIVLSEIVKSRRNNDISPQEKNIHHHIDRLEIYAKDHLAGDKEQAALSCVQGFRKATLSHFMGVNKSQRCFTEVETVILENSQTLAKHRTHSICRFLFYSAIACTGIGLFYLAYQSYQFNQAGAGSTLFNTRSHHLAHQVGQAYQSSVSLPAGNSL